MPSASIAPSSGSLSIRAARPIPEQFTMKSGRIYDGFSSTQDERRFSVLHLREPARIAGKSFGTFVAAANAFDHFGSAMSMPIPKPAKVALEAMLLRKRQASPGCFAFGAHCIHHRSPVESTKARFCDVPAKTAQQRSRIPRVQRRNYVVRRDAGVSFRKASVARNHRDGSAMIRSVESDQNVQRGKPRPYDENLTADTVVVPTPRVADVTGMQPAPPRAETRRLAKDSP